MKLEHQEACPGIILFLNRGGKKADFRRGANEKELAICCCLLW